jgi:hypothetical protein
VTTLTAASQVAATSAILAYLVWSRVGSRRHSAQSGRPVEVAVAFAIFVVCNALIQNGNTRILLVLVSWAPTAAAVSHLRMKQQFRRVARSGSSPRLP